METCYEVELRVKRMNTPGTSGTGPFERADDLEAGMKVLIYPQVWTNPATMAMLLRQIGDAVTAFYNDADGIDSVEPVGT